VILLDKSLQGFVLLPRNRFSGNFRQPFVDVIEVNRFDLNLPFSGLGMYTIKKSPPNNHQECRDEHGQGATASSRLRQPLMIPSISDLPPLNEQRPRRSTEDSAQKQQHSRYSR